MSVVAKADEHQGWPVMRLYLNGEQLGEDNPVRQARFDGGAQRFGEAELKEGDTLEAEFTNDLYEGKAKTATSISTTSYYHLWVRQVPRQRRPKHPQTHATSLPTALMTVLER